MRYAHLEHINVALKVLTPLHIGGGSQNKLRKKLLLYNTVTQTVSVPDVPKMIDYMTQTGRLAALESYLLSNESNDMYQFLRGAGINTQQARCFMAYTIACGEPVNRVNELNAFIKDGEGKPYIPGSSLKGAVRTALLSQRMNAAACEKLHAEVAESPRKRSASVAEDLLRTLPGDRNGMLRDVMRGIAFSDCVPFGSDDMIVCRKKWQQIDGTVKGNALFLECVKPGAATSFTLTLDHRILPEAYFPHALETVKAALEAWFARNLAHYDACYPEPLPAAVEGCSGCVLRLGAGTGLQTKSLLSCLPDSTRKRAIEDMLLVRHGDTRFGGKYKPVRPDAPAPYCRKVAEYGQLVQPFGYCSLTFHD